MKHWAHRQGTRRCGGLPGEERGAAPPLLVELAVSLLGRRPVSVTGGAEGTRTPDPHTASRAKACPPMYAQVVAAGQRDVADEVDPRELNRMKLRGHQNGTMRDKKRRVASRPPVFQLDLACSLWCARSHLRSLRVCPRSLSPTSGHLFHALGCQLVAGLLGVACVRSTPRPPAGHEELEPVLVRLQGGKRAFGAARRSPQWAWPQSSGHSRRRSPRPSHCRFSADAAGGARLIRFSVAVRRNRAAARTGQGARAR